MLSEEEKAHILERVQFENDLRKELIPLEKPKRSSWIESKIGLILISALITGILVPTFQYTQKRWEWQRQNRFANVTYKLGMMRDCLKEFLYLSAFAPEAYERIIPALQGQELSNKEYGDLRIQYIDLQNRRFAQIAKVTSLMIYFRKPEEVAALFDEYSNIFNLYMLNVGTFLESKLCSSDLSGCTEQGSTLEGLDQVRKRMHNQLLTLKGSYIRVAAKIKEEIGRAEDESKKFGF